MSEDGFSVLSVRRAREGSDFIGFVKFAYRPSSLFPVQLTHSVRDENDETRWKNYVDAEVEGASVVRVNSAFLCESKKSPGVYFVRCQGLNVPWDLACRVGGDSYRRLESESASGSRGDS